MSAFWITYLLCLIAGAAWGWYGPRLRPLFKRDTLLLACYSDRREFLVKYRCHSSRGYERCEYVGELDGRPFCFAPGQSLTLKSENVRPIPAGDDRC